MEEYFSNLTLDEIKGGPSKPFKMRDFDIPPGWSISVDIGYHGPYYNSIKGIEGPELKYGPRVSTEISRRHQCDLDVPRDCSLYYSWIKEPAPWGVTQISGGTLWFTPRADCRQKGGILFPDTLVQSSGLLDRVRDIVNTDDPDLGSIIKHMDGSSGTDAPRKLDEMIRNECQNTLKRWAGEMKDEGHSGECLCEWFLREQSVDRGYKLQSRHLPYTMPSNNDLGYDTEGFSECATLVPDRDEEDGDENVYQDEPRDELPTPLQSQSRGSRFGSRSRRVFNRLLHIV